MAGAAQDCHFPALNQFDRRQRVQSCSIQIHSAPHSLFSPSHYPGTHVNNYMEHLTIFPWFRTCCSRLHSCLLCVRRSESCASHRVHAPQKRLFVPLLPPVPLTATACSLPLSCPFHWPSCSPFIIISTAFLTASPDDGQTGCNTEITVDPERVSKDCTKTVVEVQVDGSG